MRELLEHPRRDGAKTRVGEGVVLDASQHAFAFGGDHHDRLERVCHEFDLTIELDFVRKIAGDGDRELTISGRERAREPHVKAK